MDESISQMDLSSELMVLTQMVEMYAKKIEYGPTKIQLGKYTKRIRQTGSKYT